MSSKAAIARAETANEKAFRELLDDFSREGGLARVVLHHVHNSRLAGRLRDRARPSEGEITPEWIQQTIGKLLGHAQNDTDATGKEQAFAITIEGDDGAVLARRNFRVQPIDATVIDSEGPDEAGQIAQQMRHSEGLMRYVVRVVEESNKQQGAALKAALDENARLRADHEKVFETRLRLFEALEAAETRRTEREAQQRMTEVKAKSIEKGAEHLAKLVPYAINHIAGEQVLKVDGPEMELMRAFVMGLTQPQLAAMDDHQLARVMTFANRLGLIEHVRTVARGGVPGPAPANGKPEGSPPS